MTAGMTDGMADGAVTPASGGRPPRVLLAKPGLDGHDRGIKVVGMALRDAGAEVVYLGMRQTVEQILEAAAEEGVDVIGLSVLSGAHLTLGGRLLEARAAFGVADVPVVIGGTIPRADAVRLESMGAKVFPMGSNLDDVVRGVLDAAAAGVARG
jgi:methylmalonyl-CoA mutase C-terminal domain/subunit